MKILAQSLATIEFDAIAIVPGEAPDLTWGKEGHSVRLCCCCTQCSAAALQPVPLRTAETRFIAYPRARCIEDGRSGGVCGHRLLVSCGLCDGLRMRSRSVVISAWVSFSLASSSHLTMRATSLIS
jgi:hypothetical protein